MKPFDPAIVGIFPSFGGTDGIGVSGLSAWRALGANNPDATLLSYGKTEPPVSFLSPVLKAKSIVGAVVNAVRARSRPGIAFFWHLHLLRLLPFLGAGRKVIVFLHGIEAWKPLAEPVSAQMRHVGLVLTNSEFTWRRFLEFNPQCAGIPHKVVALGLGAPGCAVIAPPAGPPVALMIGRAARSEAYKGHEAMARVWPSVLKALPGAELHMVGPGDLHGPLRDIAQKLGVVQSVHVHGAVSEDVKLDLLRRARCMALPSHGEGFGLAYVESMRLGRPCLVSCSDAGREVVNPPEAGLAADPSDAADLASALIRLLSPGSEWEAWSRNALNRYTAHYTEAHFQARLRAAVGSIA